MLLSILSVLAVPQTAALAQGAAKAAQVDKLMTTAHDYGQFNGSVLVAENGRVIYKKGLGLANMEWNIANTPDTKFRLGSITKQFTAMLVMQLVEAGKIKLDGKLSDYLPDYRKDVGERVTIHHLLTHTSGIPNYTALPGFMETVSRNPFAVEAFIKKYGSGDLEFEPGTKFNYDNTGYFLLGAIIEKVTGKPYEQVLKENILDPVGMKNTGYDHADTLINKRAAGYTKSARGYVNAAYLDMSLPYAAGSLYSTVEDLYLWDQALYTDKLISAKSKELMFKPNLSNYAYGWFIAQATLGETKETVPVFAHDGGINGFNTSIMRLPANKHLIVLLDNTSGGRYLGNLGQQITNILYDKPFTLPKRSIGEELIKTVAAHGVEAAIKQYRELKTTQSSVYNFNEQELNNAGYELLQMGRTKEAIEIFKLNVEAYPQGFNTYDSLGEAYKKNGDNELAIQNYKKSLELNPQNGGATRALARLNGATPSGAVDEKTVEKKVDPKIYDAYVGDYELAPNFIVSITREDDHLMGQPSGQPKSEIFPSSETEFFLKVVDAQITFVKNEQGQVTQLILHQNGQNMPARKIK
jgi:CubicO group peptidase (beta-lactamase class C family)